MDSMQFLLKMIRKVTMLAEKMQLVLVNISVKVFNRERKFGLRSTSSSSLTFILYRGDPQPQEQGRKPLSPSSVSFESSCPLTDPAVGADSSSVASVFSGNINRELATPCSCRDA